MNCHVCGEPIKHADEYVGLLVGGVRRHVHVADCLSQCACCGEFIARGTAFCDDCDRNQCSHSLRAQFVHDLQMFAVRQRCEVIIDASAEDSLTGWPWMPDGSSPITGVATMPGVLDLDRLIDARIDVARMRPDER